MVLTAYNSVFGTTGVPDGFEFVVAIDWFLDRLVTVVNVTGDNVVAASISSLVTLETSEEFDEEEADAYETANKSMTLRTQGDISPDTSDNQSDYDNAPAYNPQEMDISI